MSKDKDKIQLSKLVNMYDPDCVFDEVKAIVRMAYPDISLEPLNRVFKDVTDLFHGKYPGYRHCNTKYHDLRHTSDAFLVMARLIHGAIIEKKKISGKNAILALIATLMHDVGYIQTENDLSGTGAKYTKVHVDRSIKFMKKYYAKNGFSKEQFKMCSDLLLCTGLHTKTDEIKFSTPEIEFLGKMVGTADLVGQMSDRTYLEKLPFLFHEFREANIKIYKNELDLIIKTVDFYKTIKIKLAKEFGNVTRFFPAHFKARYGISENLYEEAIKSNMNHLKKFIKKSEIDYNKELRRTNVVFN
ncbi:MAG: hypothetical protein KKD47_05485 [Proteobacteria bacterium]|nr:hypothetical protein [Pseudomonadota bacterium]